MPLHEIDPSTALEGVLSTPRRKDLVIRGTANHVSLGSESDVSGLKIEMLGHRNRLLVGKNCRLRGHVLIKGNDLTVEIGDHTTFTGAYLLCSNDSDIRIGRWCMLSRNIEVRVTDAHSVIDATTGKRLNIPAPITIGDHVWVGVGVVINKGVEIAADNIIGAGSFVNRSVTETGCVVAGAPAKVVRRGVTWHRSQRDSFSQAEMDYWKTA